MDRRESMCMVVLILAAALICAGAASADAIPFEDGFEFAPAGTHPDGWLTLSDSPSASVVEGISSSGSKSFGLDSLPWSAQVESVALDETPDRVTYEAAVRLDASNGWMAVVGFMDRCNGSVLMWNFFCIDGKSGTVHFCGEDEVYVSAFTYTRGTWCTVRADLDYAALTADLRVTSGDDEVVVEDVPIAPKDFSCVFVSEVVSDRWGVAAPATAAFSNLVYFDDVKVWEADTTLPVDIDIKPGSDVNPVNLRSNGLLPVCVFSSETFDATRIDPATCLLAGAPVAVRTKQLKYMAHPEDIDGDGLADMLLHFETQQLDPDQLQDDYAVLVGSTFEGQDFVGMDEITLVGRGFRTRGRP
ncbi:MAG: hypothetical protein MUQ65_17570 [Armatimonadetes bacterium]|nr:hypothetical protein [Armatimonadota bacterium]